MWLVIGEAHLYEKVEKNKGIDINEEPKKREEVQRVKAQLMRDKESIRKCWPILYGSWMETGPV
jgi:hypothetical protein